VVNLNLTLNFVGS